MAQEEKEAGSRRKSLISQLRHIRDICHEGIIRYILNYSKRRGDNGK